MTAAPQVPARRGLARRAARGVLSSGASQLGKMAVQTASVVVMARILSPDDYGLVAMVLVIVGVAEQFRDLGLSNVAVTTRELSTHQRDNLFWVNSGMGLVLSALMAALAPVIAVTYGRPELVWIALALAPTFLLTGMTTQYRVDLLRRLRFHRLALLDWVSTVATLGVGIALAWGGAGYWALVGQQVFGGLLTLVLLGGSAGWRPGWFRRGAGTGPMVRKGLGFLVSGLISYAATNADAFVVARAMGASPLGVYNRAMQLVRTPLRQLMVPLATVSTPVLTRLRDDDERYVAAIERIQVVVCYPIFLAVAALCVGASSWSLLALGPGWHQAAPVMAWLAVGSAASTAAAPASDIFIVRQLVRPLAWANLSSAALTILCVGVGSAWGLVGVAAAYTVSVVLTWPVTVLWAGSAGGLRTGRLLRAGARSGLVAACCGVAAWVMLRELSVQGTWQRAAASLVAVGVAFLPCLLVPAVRRDVSRILELRQVLARRA